MHVFSRQKRLIPTGLISLFLLGCLTIATAAEMPKTMSSVKAEIEQVKAQIAEEEKLWAEERNREVEAEKRRTERYEDFKKEKQELKRAIQKTETDIEQAMAKIENLKYRKTGLENEFDSYVRELLALSTALEDRLNSSFPYRKDKRIESVALLSSDLRQQKISPEEGFVRLWSLYQQEQTMAAEAEVFSGDIKTAEGQDVSVKYVRVGKQLMAYADAPGTHLGWLKKNGDEWVWMDEKAMEYEMRQAIRDMVAVAEGKAPPGFVSVPLWLTGFGDLAEATEGSENAKDEKPATPASDKGGQ